MPSTLPRVLDQKPLWLLEPLQVEYALRGREAGNALAGPLDARRRETAASAPLRRNAVSRPRVASFAQERLMVVPQPGGGGPADSERWVLRLEGLLDQPTLAHALGEVVRRHEVLRTVLVAGDQGPRQQVLPFEGLALPFEDLASLSACERDVAVQRRLEAEIHTPLDATHGPVLRSRLLRLNAHEHLLLLSVHPSAADRWSLTVLLDELAAHYVAGAWRRDERVKYQMRLAPTSAHCVSCTPSLEEQEIPKETELRVDGEQAASTRGQSDGLPELPVQYSDYAVWQREALAGQGLDGLLGYWRQQLAGAPPRLELPTDHARSARISAPASRCERLLPRPLIESLEALARQSDATPFMALLAGWAALLGRLAGQTDVVIGTPSTLRTQPELDGLIGAFSNLLPLRVDLTGNPSFRELLARVREVSLGAYAHRELPFERLVSELQLEQPSASTPVFQVVAALAGAPASRSLAPGLTFSALDEAPRSTPFELLLVFEPRPEGLLAVLEYAADLFEARRTERLLGHLHTLLAAAVAAPDTRLGHLGLLTEDELDTRAAWNATTLSVGPETVVERIFAQARRQPDALALAAPHESLTYAQLVQASARLARELRARGVRPEQRVAVCLQPGPRMVVAALAVLAAGGAYVPLDPAYPRERLRYLLTDADVRLVLADQQSAAVLPTGAAPVVHVDALDSQPGEGTARDVDVFVPDLLDLDSLAYVVYTSGSTGHPKGVAVPHRGLANLVAWHRSHYALVAADRTSQIAAPGFDAAVWELWPTLAAGASLHFPPGELRLSPAGLLGWLADTRITVAFLPTPLAEALLAEPRSQGLVLRALLTGGDRLTRRPASDTPFRLVNHYGPTEASVVTTACDVLAQGDGPPPIGQPIANLRVHVLDQHMQPVPEGVPGELYVAGDGLARGYLNRPVWTAERFVPDPFDTSPGGRLYRTGDLVRWRSEGALDFLGRADRQVKVRGVRIEPGEIESALVALAVVEQAVVALRDERLVAYIVARPGVTWSALELRDELRRVLPESMLPAAFVALDTLPLTPHGKVDRDALPTPAVERPVLEAPRTPLEQTVARVWEQVLSVPQVGRGDDFFGLGGHSLLAGQVVARLREALGLPITLAMLFEAPTVAGLAAVLSTLAAPVAEPVLRRVERGRYRVATLEPEVVRD